MRQAGPGGIAIVIRFYLKCCGLLVIYEVLATALWRGSFAMKVVSLFLFAFAAMAMMAGHIGSMSARSTIPNKPVAASKSDVGTIRLVHTRDYRHCHGKGTSRRCHGPRRPRGSHSG